MHIIVVISRGLKHRFANISGTMDFERRSTKKFSLISPNLDELRKLGQDVTDPLGFTDRYGALLSLLSVQMKEGLLQTLIQFYDPVYHCFTFPDYQLMPTLEEYSQLLRIPIANTVPFSGSEKVPEPDVLAKILHLTESDIEKNFITRGGVRGFKSKFLIEKASYFAKAGCGVIFEYYFALLIYGLLLFPNMEGFVDSTALCIFLSGNPVPTLLGDAYHSVHYRTLKKGGTVVCCVPLLYKWFISHLPRIDSFWDHKLGLRWSQRIMSLTHSDIVWYSRFLDDVQIIDSCGEFPNVPLIGTKGIISYNPALARRHLGYPMTDRPLSILLEGLFLRDSEEDLALKKRVVRSWHKVHRKGRFELGRKDCTSYEPYLQWVRARAVQLKMPYPRQDPIIPTPLRTTYLPPDDVEKLQAAVESLTRERDLWKNRTQIVEEENSELRGQLDAIDEEDRRGKRPRGQEDLFSSCSCDDSQSAAVWKERADSLAKEQALPTKTYEDYILKLHEHLRVHGVPFPDV